MNTEKILYSINVEDVGAVSEELYIPFEEKDVYFIQKKIGDYMADKWKSAIEFALYELNTQNGIKQKAN